MQRIEAVELNISLDRAQKAAEQYLDTQSDVVRQIKILQEENKQLNKELVKLNKEAAKGDKDAIELAKVRSKEIASNKNALRELGKQQRSLNKDIDAAKDGISVYRSLTTRLSEVKKEIKELAVQGLDVPKELADEFRELDSTIRDAEESVGEFQRSVGEYQNATERLQEGLAAFVDGLSKSNSGVGALGSGVQGLSSQFKLLLANPVVAVFGAIAAILGTLFAAFQRSEKGAQFFAKATGVINGVMSALVGFVDVAIDSITSFINDPIEGIKNIGQLLQDNIINRFKGIVELAGIAGDAFQSLINRDIDGLKKAAIDAGQALIQITTGVDTEQQEALAAALAETAKNAIDSTNAFIALEESRRELQRQARELEKQLERNITLQEKEQLIADDATRSFAEREKAAEKARIASEKSARTQIQLATNSLALIQREIALRNANGENIEALRDQETAAIVSVIQAERELTLSILENEKTRNELRQDRLERDLDILIDGFDNQKTINERIIANDRETLQARQDLFEETANIAESSFQKQIDTIQQFTGVQVDANELLQESDAVVLNERIRSLGLSEIIEGRLLEVIRERRTVIQDLTESQRELNEAAQDQKITDIESERDQQLAALFSNTTATEEEISEERQKIESKADRDILAARLQAENLKQSEINAINAEIAEFDLEQSNDAQEKKLNAILATIQIQTNAQKQAILESELSEKEKNERISEIDKASLIKVLETRLELENLSKEERSNIEFELIQQREDAAISSEQKIREERQKTLSDFEQTAQGVFSVIEGLNQARLNNQLTALDEEFEQRIEAAQGNATAEQAIVEEFDQRRQQIEQEAFERQKRLSLAQAVINGATAVTKILAETPKFDFGVATAIQIALAAATTAAQIAVISSQQFAKGGLIDGASHEQGGVKRTVRSTGQRVELEGGEAVLTKRAMASNTKVKVEGTPAQIASSINSRIGGGISFANNPEIFEIVGRATSDIFKGTPTPSMPLYRESYAAGGVISSAQQQTTTLNVSSRINRDDIKLLVSEVIQEVIPRLPNPIVTVEDINTGQENVEIIENSSFVI